jgi:histidine triad (HIT) family protein
MENCQLCQAYKNEKSRIFMENDHAFAIIAKWPQNEGHSMVLPKKHVQDLSELSPEEIKAVMKLCETVVIKIDKKLNKSTITMLNSKSCRTQEHLHFQLVPLRKEVGVRDLVDALEKNGRYPEVSNEQMDKLANQFN